MEVEIGVEIEIGTAIARQAREPPGAVATAEKEAERLLRKGPLFLPRRTIAPS
jgi:hypothetical protein